jgi:nucleotide-binding universal stress UspA family protein
MKETNRIVVPVDFLKHTDKLVEYAVYMAKKFSAVPYFFHVVNFYPPTAMFDTPYVQVCIEKLLSDAEAKMSQLLADNSVRCPGSIGEVATGDPVDKILEFAKEKHSDLIIINTHGAKGLEKIMLGSVAERVLKGAHCPVLVMNPFKAKLGRLGWLS